MRLILTTLLLAFLCACKSTKIPPAPDPTTAPKAVAPATYALSFAWDLDPNHVSYRFQGRSTPTGTPFLSQLVTPNVITVSNLLYGPTNYYTVSAFNAAGVESLPSAMLAVSRINTNPPAPPLNLRVILSLQSSLSPSGPFTAVAVPPTILTNSLEDAPSFYKLSIATQEIP